jgi:cytosine/adenosine deaminase-related metal-dependent hydrolase
MNHSAQAAQTAFRAQLLTFNGDPAQSSNAAVFNEDGLLIVEDGHVVAAGAYAALSSQLAPGTQVQDMRDKLIVPGFIDTHIHYPQTDMIASPAHRPSAVARYVHVPDRAALRRSGLRAGHGQLLRRRTARLRHDHGAGLLHGA